MEDNVVPLVSGLQQHFAFFGHSAHVNTFIGAILCDAEEVQLVHKRRNIDESIIICFQNKLDVVVGDSIFQHIVCLEQDRLVVGLVVYKDNVTMLIDFLGHLHAFSRCWQGAFTKHWQRCCMQTVQQPAPEASVHPR